MVKKCVVFGFVAAFILSLASCHPGPAPSATASTSTTISTLEAERAFMRELSPDIVSWWSVISDREGGKVTDEVVYGEMRSLVQRWSGRQAPSVRTRAFFDAWLKDVRVCERYWGLIIGNDASVAEAMQNEVDMAVAGVNLPETLLHLDGALGVDFDYSPSTTAS